jgi:anti-sigma factor RsiW
MTKRCLDEGLLQAYIDGELSNEHAAEAASHIAACDACAAALASLESENSLFASAFAPDDSINVPTELLRSRIGAAVAQLEDAHGFNQKRSDGRSFGGFLTTLSGLFSFTPQRAAAFASVLAVVAAGIIYFTVIKRQGTTDAPKVSREVASNEAPTTGPKAVTKETPEVAAPLDDPKKGSDETPFVNVKHAPRRNSNRG